MCHKAVIEDVRDGWNVTAEKKFSVYGRISFSGKTISQLLVGIQQHV